MSFDANFIFGASGILLGITSVVLAIYFYKVRRYPGSITYIEDQSTSLFNSLVKNFSEIKITYDDTCITQQMALLKGVLINSGNIDISPHMIEQPLTLNLPQYFRWLNVKIVDQSEDNSSTIEIINDNKIEFKLELFRINEYLTFEALAEVPITEQKSDSGVVLSDNIKFNHRISDTDKINKENINLSLKGFWTFYSFAQFIIFPLVLIFCFFDVTGIYIEPKSNQSSLFAVNNTANHQQLKMYVVARSKSTLDLMTENGQLYRTIDIKDFDSKYIPKVNRLDFFFNIGASIIVLIIFIFYIKFNIGDYMMYRKTLQLKAILNLENQKQV